ASRPMPSPSSDYRADEGAAGAPARPRARTRWIRWLRPGLEVKRWIVLLAIGILIIDLAVAYFLKDAYQNVPWPSWTSYVTLQFLSHTQRGAVFLVFGVAVLIFSIVQL